MKTPLSINNSPELNRQEMGIAERAVFTEKAERRIARNMGKAMEEWHMVEEGDRILVGVSGGKDSYTLLHMMRRFQKRAPVRFEIIGLHLDQGHPGFDSGNVQRHLAEEGFRYRMVHKDTFSLVKAKLKDGDTTCSLCSRYRRGILYGQAEELGCNKVALGHHREDAIETLLLNLFFAGRTAGMPARVTTEDGRFTVIRPLIYVPEEEIRRYAELKKFPIEPCRLCSGTERDHIGALLETLARRNPNVRGNLLKSMQSIVPSHLLDPRLLSTEGR